MTTRALRICNELVRRLGTVQVDEGSGPAPLVAIFAGRQDLFGDDLTFPCASLLEDTTAIVKANVHGQYLEQVDLIVVGVTVSDPDAPLAAGHNLWGALMRGLFPSVADLQFGADTLGGNARTFEYVGREILPREDGGRTTAVLINLRVEYVLDTTNPDN